MSSTSSRVSAVSASASNEPECEPLPSARSIPTAAESSPSTGQLSLFSETSEPSQQKLWPTIKAADAERGGRGDLLAWVRGYENKHYPSKSMSSAAVSPVKTSQSPERVQVLKGAAAAYGRITPELLARFDPDTSSWRTSQLCLDGAFHEFSETWPRSGLMRNGTAYLLPPLVRLTDETDYGSLPTPSATSYGTNQGGGMGRVGPVRPSLDTMARKGLWPTPTQDGNYNRKGASATSGDELATAVGGALNPTWVEWLMGFPLGWTALEASGMQSSRKSRKSSGGRS
jgi:hypothetical protein